MTTADPFQRLSLGGRVVAITGGTGGIGSETARLCAARGASVVIADLDSAAGEALASSIRESGGSAAFIRTDVSSEDDAAAMVEFAAATFGGLHAAFNNAGIDTGHVPVADTPLEQWQRNLSVNLTGVFLCMKHEITHMLAHGGGAIVNTSSTSGAIATVTSADYTAAKHGVVGVTRSAAVDYSARGIRVNAVLPGGIATPMLMGALVGNDPLRRVVEAAHPIGRIGQPHEVAEAAAFLLSDAAAFITGACLMVDGGFTSQ
jgi:2,5-dichloro-2,5-cyclohexadiene-1,4-diol dehydrogenase 1